MDALKEVVKKGGGLKKTDLNEEEKEKRGIESTIQQMANLKKKDIQEVFLIFKKIKNLKNSLLCDRIFTLFNTF